MIISLILAAGKNGAIGIEGKLPWHLPDDFKFFKNITMGKTLVMGRKTYESIGRPLPGRKTIIITRSLGLEFAGCEVVNSLDQALELCRKNNEEEVFIAGGGEIYKQAINLANRIYLTQVHFEGNADTYFDLDFKGKWKEECLSSHKKDERHAYEFEIKKLERV